MNPEGSESSSKLLTQKSKYLKRFNSKLNPSTYQSTHQISQPTQNHAYQPPINIRERQKSPLRHKPIIDKYLSHISYVENKVQDQQRIIEALMKENEQKSQQFERLKKNYQILKQENIELEQRNFQAQSLSKSLADELEISKKKIAIVEIQFQDKLNQTQNKFNQMQQNTLSRASFKRGRSRAKDTNSASTSQIEIYSPQQNPQTPKITHTQKLNEILNTNPQSQKKYLNLEISFQEKSNLCKKLEAQIETLKQKIFQLQQIEAKHNDEALKIETALEGFNKKLQFTEIQNSKLKIQINTLEAKLQEKTKEILIQRNEKKQKIIEFQKLEEEFNAIEESHIITKKCYEDQIQSLNSKITQLAILIQQEPKKQRDFQNNQLLKKNELIQELEQEKQKLENLVKNLTALNNKKQASLTQIQRISETLKGQNEKLIKEKQNLNKQKNTLQHSYEKMEKQLTQLKVKLTNFESKLAVENQTNAKLASKQESLVKEISELKNKVQEKSNQIKDKQEKIIELEQKLNQKQTEIAQLFKKEEQTGKKWQLKCIELTKSYEKLEQQKQSILKQSQQHKLSLQSYKEQCSQVVKNLASQLEQSQTSIQSLTQSNNSLASMVQQIQQQSNLKQQQIDLLKQEIQNLKQFFGQEKLLLEEQLKSEIHTLNDERDKLVEQMGKYRQIEISQKEQQWEDKLQLIEKEKVEVIEQLENKIKKLQQRIYFMEEQSHLKEEEVIRLIKEKNHIIQNKEYILMEKQQEIQTLKQSSSSILSPSNE